MIMSIWLTGKFFIFFFLHHHWYIFASIFFLKENKTLTSSGTVYLFFFMKYNYCIDIYIYSFARARSLVQKDRAFLISTRFKSIIRRRCMLIVYPKHMVWNYTFKLRDGRCTRRMITNACKTFLNHKRGERSSYIYI